MLTFMLNLMLQRLVTESGSLHYGKLKKSKRKKSNSCYVFDLSAECQNGLRYSPILCCV